MKPLMDSEAEKRLIDLENRWCDHLAVIMRTSAQHATELVSVGDLGTAAWVITTTGEVAGQLIGLIEAAHNARDAASVENACREKCLPKR